MQQDGAFDWLVKRLPGSRPLRVLDVGCGECLEGEALVTEGVDLIGIDLDEATIASARERLPGATFMCADAATLDGLWRHPFDLLIVRRPDVAAQPDRWRHVLEVAATWLSPGGLVLLTTPGPHEADLASQWLGQLGFLSTQSALVALEDEAHLVAARAAEDLLAGAKPSTARVANWIDFEEPGLVCDLRTGVCGL